MARRLISFLTHRFHHDSTGASRFRVSGTFRLKAPETRPGAVSAGNWATPGMFGRATKTPRHLVLAPTPATPDDGASGCVTRVRCHEFRAQSRSGGPGDSRGHIIPSKTQQDSETGGGAWCSVDRENAGLQPSEQRTPIEHVHPPTALTCRTACPACRSPQAMTGKTTDAAQAAGLTWHQVLGQPLSTGKTRQVAAERRHAVHPPLDGQGPPRRPDAHHRQGRPGTGQHLARSVAPLGGRTRTRTRIIANGNTLKRSGEWR